MIFYNILGHRDGLKINGATDDTSYSDQFLLYLYHTALTLNIIHYLNIEQHYQLSSQFDDQ